MLNGVLQIKEASRLWSKDVRTLRAVFAKGVSFKHGIDVDKTDGTWLVTKEAMERVYGRIELNKTKKREAKVSDKYKIVVCNLGYTDESLSKIDGNEGNLRDINKFLRNITNSFKRKTIDDFKIDYECKGNLAPFQFNYDDVVMVCKAAEEPDRCIYIRYLD